MSVSRNGPHERFLRREITPDPYKDSPSQENKLHPGAGKAKKVTTLRKLTNDTQRFFSSLLTWFQSGQQTCVCAKHLSRLGGSG